MGYRLRFVSPSVTGAVKALVIFSKGKKFVKNYIIFTRVKIIKLQTFTFLEANFIKTFIINFMNIVIAYVIYCPYSCYIYMRLAQTITQLSSLPFFSGQSVTSCGHSDVDLILQSWSHSLSSVIILNCSKFFSAGITNRQCSHNFTGI